MRSFRLAFSESEIGFRIWEQFLVSITPIQCDLRRAMAPCTLENADMNPTLSFGLPSSTNMTQCSNWVHRHQQHRGQPLLARSPQTLHGRIPPGWRSLRHSPHVITEWRGFSFTAGEKCLLWLLIKTCEATWVQSNFFFNSSGNGWQC